jgi:hypothetical protein
MVASGKEKKQDQRENRDAGFQNDQKNAKTTGQQNQNKADEETKE